MRHLHSIKTSNKKIIVNASCKRHADQHSLDGKHSTFNNMSMTRYSDVNIKIYFTFFNSTSKTRVEFGGITGGEPLAPYL